MRELSGKRLGRLQLVRSATDPAVGESVVTARDQRGRRTAAMPTGTHCVSDPPAQLAQLSLLVTR
jgi:hypothetical protein